MRIERVDMAAEGFDDGRSRRPLPDQRRAAAALRACKLVEVEGRHISPVDAPDATVDAIIAFMDGELRQAQH